MNDKEFLRFILEVFSTAVRDESKNWEEALEKINEFLKRDGFEIYESDNISGRQSFQYRRYSEMKIKLESQSNKNANLHLIGEGSYALVYYYKDDFYNKKIALKRAKKDLTSKELERFKREFDELKSFKYIHSKGRLHRDINPKNILIKIYNDVKVIKISDFGLIKQEESSLTTINTEFKGWFNDPNWRIIVFDESIEKVV